MRVLGYIEHPQLKITVFKMDDRLSVKFENAGYEQTFKLGQDDRLPGLEAVRRWIDEPLLEAVQVQFQAMHRAKLAALSRAFPEPEEMPFDEIV